MKISRQTQVKRQLIKSAHGRWEEIILLLAPKLSDAISKRPRHVPCPIHGGKDGLRSFGDFNETGGMVCNTCGFFPNGILVLEWVNGWSTKKSMQAVKSALQNPTSVHESHTGLNSGVLLNKSVNENALRVIHKMHDEVIPITDPKARPARRYLKNRGLQLNEYPDTLTFHLNLPYYDPIRGLLGNYPALIARVEKNSDLITFHRTYITKDGYKAKVSCPKKLLTSYRKGEISGAAIHLFEPDDHLAVAEGIETALAVYESTGIPVWATITAGGMKSLEVHKHIKRVDIYADLDLSGTGEKAAYALKQRLLKEGKSVNIYLPGGPIPAGQKSKDWLDVLLEEDAA